MTKGILCSIDFSESSKEALRWSVSLAKLLNSNLTILHTYRLLNSHNGEVVELKKKIEENAIKNFALLEKELLAGEGIQYNFKVEVGFVSNRVKDYAKKNGVSFLVMGNKMNSNNKESFDELAQNVHVPLVIIP
jgi:nucleotide-binding universal stress UspA family protein